MSQFRYIEVIPHTCQSFDIGDYNVRLNYNYLFNYWTYSLRKNSEPIRLGVRLIEGQNIFDKIDDMDDLTPIDTVGRPREDWYDRLTAKNRNGIPDTVLVVGSANP